MIRRGTVYFRESPLVGLAILVLIYLGMSLMFSSRTPLSKAPDEYVHFLYTRFLVDYARPPINEQERQAAGYKSDQPPLYHALVALVTSTIDISEPPAFKFTWEPHRRQLIDIVLPRAILVRTEDETWPYAGLFLAWFVGRWVSILLSCATIVVTYFIAREIFPHQAWLAPAASGTLAFLPRYIFTGSVLSDDNLIGLLMALFLWLVIRLAKTPDKAGPGRFAMIGAIMGLALITKYSVVLVPLELMLLVVWLSKGRPAPWLYGVSRLLAAGLVATAIVSLWLGFVIWNFNQIDKFGPVLGIINPLIVGDASDETSALISGFLTGDQALVVESDPGSSEGSLFEWLALFFEQFWDVPVFGSPRLYPVLTVLLPGFGLCLVALVGWWRRWRSSDTTERGFTGVLLLHLVTFLPVPLIRFAITGQIHDTAQARHLLFPAAPALAIVLAAGVAGAFGQKRRLWAAFIPAGFTFSLAVLHLYYFGAAFPEPLPVRSDSALAGRPEHEQLIDFEDGLRLRGYDWQLEHGNEILALDLYWQSTALADNDYRTEITLEDTAGTVERRWLSHPAGGRFPTRAWDVGDSVRDRLQVPLVGLGAGRYTALLRLLDWDDQPLPSDQGDRLKLMRFVLEQPAEGGSPALWQAGRPAEGLPLYRYRATIPLWISNATSASLVGPNEQRYGPAAGTNGLFLFMVDYNWPSGLYRAALDDTGVTMLELQIENFDRNFSPPEMGYAVEANFNNDVRLLGYDLPVRRIEAGDGVPLVLYWQSLRRLTKNYIIFDRLLDGDQQAWGGYDRLPKEIYPTSLWVPGEVVTDGFAVPVAADAPDGIYNIVVGLYDEADPETRSLPLIGDDQSLELTTVTIGPVKVGKGPSDVIVTQPDIEHRVDVNFGDLIRLVGYDIESDSADLNLSLYWESLNRTAQDYTVFLHLLDEQNQLEAQGDHPPAKGRYPTSLWEVGEVIGGSTTISLAEAPAGEYRLVIGLYDRWSGERLVTVDASGPQQDQLLLQTIQR